MNSASVGFHCPECVKKGSQKVYRGVASLQTRPLLTQILIAINVGVFVLGVLMTGPDALQGASELILDGGLLTRGRLTNGELIGVDAGQWYRLVTSGFLHYGLIHLGFNMYALWILGGMLENVAGRVQLGLVYGVSLLAGSFGALLVSPDSLTAGASGAVYGLMGAVLALGIARGIPVRQSPVFGVLLLNLLITFTLSRYISVGGHIGGLAGGFLSGMILFELPKRVRLGGTPASGSSTSRSAATTTLAVTSALCVALAAVFVVASITVAAR